MKLYLLSAMSIVAMLAVVPFGQAQEAATSEAPAGASDAAKPPALNYDMKTLDGKDVNLADKYKGKVVLLVNVASFCGNTPQYEQLQAMHAKYGEQGLAVVGVPCNQFGQQEPGTAAEIAEFCEETYGVKFDMLAKVDVNGENACDLYKYLTSEETNPQFAGRIPWNFEKFLIGRNGEVVNRYQHRMKPDEPQIVEAIEAELAKQSPAES